MKLLEAIDQAIDSPIDTKRFRSLRGIVAEFLGDDSDADLLITVTPGWTERFADYLSTYPNRLNKAKSPYLSEANQRLYLNALRSLLRKATVAGAYPDIDTIQPILDKSGEVKAQTRRPSAQINLQEQLKRLCTLNLSEEEAALRNVYFLGLAAGGLELNEIATLKEETTANQQPSLSINGNSLSSSEFLLSLLKSAAPSESPLTNDSANTDKPKVTSARLRRFFAERNIFLYQAESIFSDLLAIALPAVGSEEIARAAERRLLNPAEYFKNIKHYQSVLSSTCKDQGMLAQRWYAMRSLNPKQSGADIENAIRIAPEEISSLVSDTYAPNDLLVIERNGVRTTRNHPAVRNLLFIKTLRPYIPRILKYVGDAAAYKRTAEAADGYFTIPYSEIYRMKLVLGAIGADETTEIYTNEELQKDFPIDELSIGDLVTVSKPGYEQFTARVIRRKGHDYYCVSFEDFGFNLVMTDIHRLMLQEIKPTD